MLNVVIFGAPGSGKGTQSQKIIDKYGLHHISTGEVLRDNISRGTELGKLADSLISKGNLIPDEVIVKVLANALDANPEALKRGVIFDGFPRTIPQAIELNKILEQRGTTLHAVIGLEVPEDELMDRMLKRGRESGRADDNPETIKNRLKVYATQTEPLRDYYIAEGKYRPVNGAGSLDAIFAQIDEHLQAL